MLLINNIVSAAFRKLGLILRHSRLFSIRSLYRTYACPCLEYAAIIWSPYYDTHIRHIEKVQEKFLKALAYWLNLNISGLLYSDQCELLGSDSLERRRDRQDLLFLFKLVNGSINAPNLLELLNLEGLIPLVVAAFLEFPCLECNIDSIHTVIF